MVQNLPGRPLLKGPTAFSLAQSRNKVTTLAIGLLGLAMMLQFLHVPQSWLTNGLMILIGLIAIPGIVLINWMPIKVRAEQRARYTSLLYGNKALEQRDPYFGRVIRQAGEDYLDPAAFRAIVKAAKQDYEEGASQRGPERG